LGIAGPRNAAAIDHEGIEFGILSMGNGGAARDSGGEKENADECPLRTRTHSPWPWRRRAAIGPWLCSK